jgi:hypothetical protein
MMNRRNYTPPLPKRLLSPSEPFGCWRVGTVGLAHYHLGGKPLCGSEGANADGPEPPRGPYGPFIYGHQCCSCMELNVERWRRSGTPRVEKTKDDETPGWSRRQAEEG